MCYNFAYVLCFSLEIGNIISLASLVVALGVLVVMIVSSVRQAKRAASKATKDAMQGKADRTYVDTEIQHMKDINQKEHEMTREMLVDLKEEFKTTMDSWFDRVDKMYGNMSEKVNREINEHEHRFHGK